MNKKINLLCSFALLIISGMLAFAIYTDAGAQDDNSSSFRVKVRKRNPNPLPLHGNTQQETPPGNLTAGQLQKLAGHDIVLLIDKSESMSTHDCPSANGLGEKKSTRWQWCQSQTAQMSALTSQVLPEGFTVLLFDSHYHLFPHVNTNTLAEIFARNHPGGHTNLIAPLSSVFDDYFKRRQASHGKVKPLLIGIITDGQPDHHHEVQKMIAGLTHIVQDPQEITIVFFLIGNHDSKGENFVSGLCNKLVYKGASFNIVKGVSFTQVQTLGLAQALADNLD